MDEMADSDMGEAAAESGVGWLDEVGVGVSSESSAAWAKELRADDRAAEEDEDEDEDDRNDSTDDEDEDEDAYEDDEEAEVEAGRRGWWSTLGGRTNTRRGCAPALRTGRNGCKPNEAPSVKKREPRSEAKSGRGKKKHQK